MQSDADVIVVGLGAVGAALAFQLAEAGVRVLGLEQFGPAHAFGSSHGETRITRDYPGEGDEYVPLVARSHRIWADLEARGHRGLRGECGLLVMARRSAGGGAAAERHGVPDFLGETVRIHESASSQDATILDADAIRARFPQFSITDDTVAYFDPDGGYVRPEACVRAQLDEAAKHPNAAMLFGTEVTRIRHDGAAVVVSALDGEWRAPEVVVCAGAWIPGLVGGPYAEALHVRPQVQTWFEPTDRELWARAPAYIWFYGETEADMIYGFPLVDDASGVKVASEQYDEAASPDLIAADGGADAAAAAGFYDRHVAGNLAGLSSRLTQAVPCLYTVNEGGPGGRRARFLIGAHPTVAGVTVVSACSGHGFKHSAGLGQALAERLQGRAVPELDVFTPPWVAASSR